MHAVVLERDLGLRELLTAALEGVGMEVLATAQSQVAVHAVCTVAPGILVLDFGQGVLEAAATLALLGQAVASPPPVIALGGRVRDPRVRFVPPVVAVFDAPFDVPALQATALAWALVGRVPWSRIGSWPPGTRVPGAAAALRAGPALPNGQGGANAPPWRRESARAARA